MKKTMLVLLLCITVGAGSLFATDQILRAGLWSTMSDLRDIPTPDELNYMANPYVVYTYGRASTDTLTGSAYMDVPYRLGAKLNTIWPSIGGNLKYRFQSGQSAIMETGLAFSSNKSAFTGTYVSATGFFDWYPYNQAKEVTVHRHFVDLIEGLRLGVGIKTGATVNQVLEAAAVTTDLNGGITGILASGAKLSDNFWFQGHVQVGFPNLALASSFTTYEVSATSLLHAALSYVSYDLVVTTAITANITIDKLLTSNSIFRDTIFSYSFVGMVEVGYFFLDDVNVYGGIELYGNRGSLIDNVSAYVGVQYFLL